MSISEELKVLIKDAVISILKEKGIEAGSVPDPIIERPRYEKHGDYASNIAMVFAGKVGMKPREMAEGLKKALESSESIIESVSVAGPGFINFFLKKGRYIDLLQDIFSAGESFGKINLGKGEKLQIEFVSANPTGPLHVGHGRGAIYGDALANVLSWAGYEVTREYYLNDAGNQILTLGRSVHLRINELLGEEVEFPAECYQGHYIVDIAREIMASKDYDKIKKLPEDDAINLCGKYAADKILEEIKGDLADCGIVFDTYFRESSLFQKGQVEEAIKKLDKKGYILESEGAVWFKTTDFGDEKDRVIRKSTGEYTYFASDIAYHFDKFKRGFKRVVDVWGADHGGHVLRMKAAIQALGCNPDNLDLILIQLVNLIQKGEVVSMSTRAATYETLSSLINDVGKDVCRYFFLMRSHNAQLDFDLELAKTQSPENPVYYIQYAHARIASVFRKAAEQEIKFDPGKTDLNLLDLEEETKIARFLGEFPAVIKDAANNLEPHKIAFYLLELARIFQSYYSMARKDDRYKVVFGEETRIQTKLYLLKNIQIVLKNGLRILGIDAPEEMIREDADAGI
jgi:arginyl-tRNA synthetase